jgi:hypothetical protein
MTEPASAPEPQPSVAEPLRECPFCDGDKPYPVKVLRDGYANFPNDPDAYAHTIRCRSCAAEGGWAKSATGAVRNWNRRSQPAAGSAALRDALERIRDMAGSHTVALNNQHPAGFGAIYETAVEALSAQTLDTTPTQIGANDE